jgi:peptide/nickel transport system substrate-binding protein
MITALLRAETEKDFVSSVRAFDRVLMSADYAIPLFFAPNVWVAYWSHLKHPGTAPLAGIAIDTWWTEGR